MEACSQPGTGLPNWETRSVLGALTPQGLDGTALPEVSDGQVDCG